MSLINDALKRASQSQKEQPREVATAAPMQAVQEAPKRSKLPLILCCVSAALLGCAGIFFWMGNSKPAPKTPIAKKAAPAQPAQPAKPAPAPAPAPVAARPVSATPASSTPAAPARPTTAAVAAVPSAPTTAPAAKPAPSPVSAPKPAPAVTPAAPVALPVTFPALQIKGIIYQAKNPVAMINGRTLGIGDTILDAKIVKIQRRSVTLEYKGQLREYPLD